MSTEDELIIDVRTREEFFKEHIKGAFNIPLYDLDYYMNFLKDKDIILYSKTGVRAQLAAGKLETKGINTKVLKDEEHKKFDWEINVIVCAVRHVWVKPEHERVFKDEIKKLCDGANSLDGFLGAKILKVSGISGEGSNITGHYENFDFIPTKYLLLTYWDSKEDHERSHQNPFYIEVSKNMNKYYARVPYEEFYDIIR